MTTEFEAAVRSQSRSLGFEPAIVWVPHPIQNRTARELEELAEAAIPPILRGIVRPATEG